MATYEADDARREQRETREALRPLRRKRRKGEVLTPAEQRTWDQGQRTLARVGHLLHRARGHGMPPVKEYDSTSGASGRSTGASITQGPAGGVTRVVRGGLPGLGKRT